MALTDVERQILAANLVAARERHKWNSTYAAGRAGVLLSQLSMWETGDREPELPGLLKLAVAYQCRVDDFLGGVSQSYDAIIEAPIPLDVKRHYEAREEALIVRMTTALQSGLSSRARGQATLANATAIKTGSAKSSEGPRGVARARRKRKK